MSGFRIKTKLAFAALVVVVFVALYLVLVRPQAKQIREDMHKTLARSCALVENDQRLSAHELSAIAVEMAQRAEISRALSLPGGREQRIAAYDAITTIDEDLKQHHGKAAFLAIVNKQGRVVARDLNINAMADEPIAESFVERSLAGYAGGGLFLFKGRLMRVGSAPVGDRKQVRGAIVIAYDIAAAEARAQSEQLGAHVAYFFGGKVHASSFRQPRSDEEDAARVSDLERALSAHSAAHAESCAPAAIFNVSLGGEDFMALPSAAFSPLALPMVAVGSEGGAAITETARTDDSRAAGWIVLVSVNAQMSLVQRMRWVLGFGLLATLLLLITAMSVVAQHFVNAEDRLELGVNEVISGNLDYTFEASEEFEGLANALNVMLARLLGRPEPTDGSDTEWRAE